MNMILVLLGLCMSAAMVSVWVGWKNRSSNTRGRSRYRTLACTTLACVLLPCLARTAQAQEVIHALAGTVSVLNPATHTFSLTTEDGSLALFTTTAVKNIPITFSKEVEAQTVAPNAFHTLGAHVLVLYYGVDTVKTAVAIRNLGTAPLVRVAGNVSGFDKHRHAMTVRGDTSAPIDLLVSADTLIDTPNGVVEGLKYHPNKGEHVGAVLQSSPAGQTTVFISATGPRAA